MALQQIIMSIPLFTPLLHRIGTQTPIPTPVDATRFNHHLLILSLAVFTGYLTVGIPLPAISLFVKHQLQLNDTLVGLAIGASFISTIFTRSIAGNIADRLGAHIATRSGFIYMAYSGLAYLGATWVATAPIPYPQWFSYVTLITARLIFGVGESLFITGIMTWGISFAGAQRSGKVMSWTGMAMYGSLAIGAPVGLILYNYSHTFTPIGIAVFAIPLIALTITATTPAVHPNAKNNTQRLPFSHILKQIWPLGTALALQGIGFASISAFATLYFQSQQWNYAAPLALTAFGTAFVLMRIFLGNLPDKIGGLNIAAWSFAIETAGLATLAMANTSLVALVGAALTGFGCSLIYPSLGSVVVRRVTNETRGAALGAYAVFQDVAYAFTGPLTGILVGILGYRSVYAFATLAAIIGFAITWYLKTKQTP